MRVPKRRPPKPHSCSWSRSPLRQWAAAKPSQVMKPNSARKMMRAVQFTSCMASSGFFLVMVRGCAPELRSLLGREIDDGRQDGADDDPKELVPVKEWDAGPGGLELVVEGRPQDRDKLDHEKQIP